MFNVLLFFISLKKDRKKLLAPTLIVNSFFQMYIFLLRPCFPELCAALQSLKLLSFFFVSVWSFWKELRRRGTWVTEEKCTEIQSGFRNCHWTSVQKLQISVPGASHLENSLTLFSLSSGFSDRTIGQKAPPHIWLLCHGCVLQSTHSLPPFPGKCLSLNSI